LPSLYGYMRLPILAVLAYSSASVEIPLILGPNTPPTLAVAIMQWFNDVDLSLRIKASSGAVIQILVTLSLLLTWWGIELLVKKCSASWLTNGEREHGGMIIKRVTDVITFIMISTIAFALLGMVLWSFAGFWSYPNILPDQFLTMHWQSAFTQMQTPLFNTLIIAFSSTLLAIILTLLALESEQQSNKTISAVSGLIIYLPLLIPSIAFLFGLVWMFEQVNSQHTYLNVVFTHLLFVLPYVFLSLANSYRRLDPRFSSVAASLGAPPSKIFWQLKLPLLISPILIASALGLAISFSQYLPTLLAGAGRINTITTEAVTLANGASRRASAVYALMQMLLPALFFILAWLTPKILSRARA